MLVIQRDGTDTAERLVVDVGEAGIDFEVVEQGQHLDGGAGQDGEADLGMADMQGCGQRGHDRQRGRHRGDAQMAGETAFQGADFVAHGTGVADDAPRPIEHAQALGREADEAGAALHQQDADAFLQLFQPG